MSRLRSKPGRTERRSNVWKPSRSVILNRMQAWVDFDEQVKAANAFVLNGALAPASSEARLVQTAIAGHALAGAVERRPFAEDKRQIQAFYIMELDIMDAAVEWANKLPTYGYVEVRELLQY